MVGFAKPLPATMVSISTAGLDSWPAHDDMNSDGFSFGPGLLDAKRARALPTPRVSGPGPESSAVTPLPETANGGSMVPPDSQFGLALVRGHGSGSEKGKPFRE